MVSTLKTLFKKIFQNIQNKSRNILESLIVDAYSMDELQDYMDERKIVRVNWCGNPDCAFNIKDLVAGEIRGTRWDIEEEPTSVCIMCGDAGKYIGYVSRTY
jgi:hypothetical protein